MRQKQKAIEMGLSFTVYAVLLLYPVTMFVYKGIRSEYFGVLVLAALTGLVIRSIRPSLANVPVTHKWVLISFVLISFIAWLSFAYFGFQEIARPRLVKFTWFILAVPLYYLFRHIRPRVEMIWMGLVVGSLVAGGRALLEEFQLVEEISWEGLGGRANGAMHPIRFGDLSLLLGFMSLAGALYLQQIKLHIRILGLVAFSTGVIASILSLSRGGWLAVPLLLFVVLIPWWRHRGKLARLLVPGLMIALLVSIFLVPSMDVNKRLDQARNDLVRYFEKGDSRSSLGARLDMFETAYHIFLKSPVFGVGIGSYHSHAQEYFEKKGGKLSREVVLWKNPHNELLLQAATRGIPGILSFLVLFVSMGFAFTKALGSTDASVLFHAVAGLSLVIGYAVFGMSIALFEHRDFLLFFVIYGMLFLAGVNPGARQSI